MITKLLDGLEMFLGVGVMFLNSSKLERPGGRHIYSPPSLSSRLYPLEFFCAVHRLDR